MENDIAFQEHIIILDFYIMVMYNESRGNVIEINLLLNIELSNDKRKEDLK